MHQSHEISCKRRGALALPGSTSLRSPFQFRRKLQPALFQALGFVQSHLEPFATIGHLCRGGLAGQLRLWNARTRYGLPVYKAHNALTDAVATAELYLAQVAENAAVKAQTLKTLKSA